MSKQEHRFYADEHTREILSHTGETVLLLGGYAGYANFGDVLQLKGAIEWHRAQSRLEPVVLCHLSAANDADWPTRVRKWFGVRGLLLASDESIDTATLGFQELTSSHRISHLHVYGGGFLNEFWGEATIDLIESLHRQFGVGHYVLSGQQVAPTLRNRLAAHFRSHRPLLAGARDAASLEILSTCGVNAADSFDDAIEPMTALASQFSRSAGCVAHTGALIHMNLSRYVSQDRSDLLETWSKLLAQLSNYLSGPPVTQSPRVTLLQAYNNPFDIELVDSLSAVEHLDHLFPFKDYCVIDLSRMALELDPDTRPARRVDLPARVAVVSSYHAALLCSMLGIPCYLHASNDFYRQKASGLEMEVKDMVRFLEHPQPIVIDDRLAARDVWLEQLAEVYDIRPLDQAPVLPPRIGSHAEWKARCSLEWIPSLFRERENATQWLEQQVQNWRAANDRSTVTIQEFRSWVEELQAGKDWLEQQVNNWRAANDRSTVTIQEFRSWIEELQAGKDWLEQQVNNWRAANDRSTTKIEELRAKIDELQSGKD